MSRLGEAFVEIVADTRNFGASVKTAVDGAMGEAAKGIDNRFKEIAANTEAKMRDVGDSMTKAGKTASKRLTAPIVGVGVAALRAGMRFDDQMARVQAISGTTGADLTKLRDQALEMGSQTRFSASEAAEGMEFLALAGFEVNEIMGAMPGLLDLASAAGMDLGRASDIVSDTMSAFGLNADQAGFAADIFARQSSIANTNVDQLGEAMKMVAPTAAAAGLELGDTAAILGVFADSGIKGGMAGTTLNAVFTDLLNNVEDGIVDFDDFSVALFDAEGNFRDMGQVISEIEANTQGMSDAQRENALRSVFQSRSMRGVNLLMGDGAKTMEEYRQANRDSAGAAGEMAEIMEDTLGGAVRALRSALEGILIQLSDLLVPIIRESVIPLFQRFGEFINDMIERFRNLDERTQRFIIAAVGIVAAIGPVLVIFGTFIKMIAFLVKPLFGLIRLVTGLAKVLTFVAKTVVPLLLKAFVAVGKALFVLGKIILANPLFLIPVLIIALVALFWHFREQIIEAVKKAWEWVTDRTQQFMDWISDGIKRMVDAVVGFFTGLRDRVQDLWQRLRDFLVGRVEQIRDRLVDGVQFLRDRFVDAVSAMANGVKAPINMIIGFFNGVIRGAEAMLNAVGSALRGLPSFTVPNWVPRFGGSQFRIPSFGPISLPRIPQLATGGIVLGDTLARIGEAGREAVVPLDRDRDPLNIAGLLADANVGRETVVNVTINNPEPETASMSVTQELRKLSALGVFGD